MTSTQPLSEIIDEFQYFCRESALNALKVQDIEVREALLRRQIPPQKVPRLESTYSISVRLGAGISLRRIRSSILQQIDAAAAFLRDFQIGILGQRTSLFQLYEIEILIAKDTPFAFEYSTGKLLVHLPHWKLRWQGAYCTYSQFRRLWDKGEHLSRSPLKAIWWLFNPLGEFRSNLKSTLILAVQKQVLGLDKLLLRFGLLEAAESEKKIMTNSSDPLVPKTFKQGVISYFRNMVNEKKLGVDLELVLQNKDDRALLQLLRRYKNTLTDPSHLEEIVDVASLTLQEALKEEQAKVDIRMFGLVNVGNYHRIDVDINLTAGYWRKYVEVVPRQSEIRATQLGLVNVYTVDDVTVAPTFHQGMKVDFETAALERTLRDFETEGNGTPAGSWLQ